MKRNDLVQINADAFYEGMRISSEVFFRYEDTFILLCKDVTLTRALLKKFYQTEWASRELYVLTEHIEGIMEMSRQFKEYYEERGEERHKFERTDEDEESITDMVELVAKINLHKDYTNLRNRLGDVMDTIQKERRVPMEAVSLIQDDISEKIETADPAILIEFINNIRQPDDYLNAHAANVAMLNGLMGTWLKLPKDEVDALVRTGLLHDIGKLSIGVEILNKPGPLTAEEFEEIKKHPIYSHEMTKFSGETDQRILDGVLSHHEKLNGTGYPRKLQINDIPLFSRITAVSDVYDAMVARRSYKARHSPFEILEEFSIHKFSDLDISIVNTFLDNMPATLVGKDALLSDGRSAKVVYVNPLHFSYPVVDIDGELIITNEELGCVAMLNFLVTVDD